MDDSYEQVPYPGLPMPQTHPDRLATVATMLGMTPAPPERCRVLELGSGDGGNLIPMAVGLSESRFTGIEFSERAVQCGCAVLNKLALRNIDLRQGDLACVGAELGEFDYIIAHGVYSWVPPNVREHLLRICRANLAPHGVAYVSYNAYPGFHRRQMFREMILHHVTGIDDPANRFQGAMELMDWLIECKPRTELQRSLLAEELDHLKETDWRHLYHDDLEIENHAEYLHEFLDHARNHGLEYLGEADFFEMQDDTYPPETLETLRRFAQEDVARKEQYLDFMKGRCFRQTLLRRREAKANSSRGLGQFTRMCFASSASPVAAVPDLSDGATEQFRGPRDSALHTSNRQVKTALVHLHRIWPESIPFGKLLTIAGGAEEPLADMLLRAYRAGLIEVNVRPSAFTTHAGHRPAASQLARLQAEQGNLVTTLRHTTAQLEDDVDRRLLLLLDGTRNREALAAALSAFTRLRALPAGQALDTRLERIARQALLVP